MKAFYISGGLEWHYGQRVFLHTAYVQEMLAGTRCFIDQLPHEGQSDHPVAQVLRQHCLWGGSDKQHGSWHGYEVTSDPKRGTKDIMAIVKVLQEQGLTQLDECPWGGGRHLVRAIDERDEDGIPLYWSNEYGWASKDTATVFTTVERKHFNLPVGGEWEDA